jgi:putative spermidine/putrescine transport system ATP-binding protein
MRKGEIQQIGTPADIYARPANLFVADFMGFKNIWPATLTKLDGQGAQVAATLNIGDLALIAHLKDTAPQVLRRLQEAAQQGKRVFTAIRPEDIKVAQESQNTIRCKTELAEYLGQIHHITASALSSPIKVDMRTAERLDEGQVVSFWAPPDKIKVFPEE